MTAMAIGCMRAKNMSAGPDAAMYPCAHFGDGALDVVTVGDVPEIEFFRRAFCVVFRGKRDTGVEAEYVKATEVLMESVPGQTNFDTILMLFGCPGTTRVERLGESSL